MSFRTSAALRRGLRHLVSEVQSRLLIADLGRGIPREISAMVRVKNEEDFLYASIRSIAEHGDEIVLVDNLSSDRTPEIIAVRGDD